MDDSQSIGIDFGTTFSLIYLFDGDRPEPVVYNCKTMFIPTKISYSYNSESQEDCWYYGFEAERDTERTTVIDVKRMLGMSAELPNLNDLIEEWKKLGIKIKSSNDPKCFPRDKIEIEFKRNNEDVFYMSPEKLAGNYIKYLVKDVAEVELNQNQKVVITIPANYSSNQRKATLDAAEFAGFNKENVTLLHEPSAAALCYMMQNKRKPVNYNNLLVCDIGGGTFDLSLLNVSKANFDVKRIDGDRYLGGRDFDELIYKWAMKQYESRGIHIDNKYSKKNIEICKEAKEELTLHDYSEIRFEGSSEQIKIKKSDFDNECQKANILDRVEKAIMNLLNEENMSKSSIDGVLLIGGSSKIPIIVQKIKDMFENNKILKFNKEREAVAMGACYLAAIKNNEIDFDVKNTNFNQRLAHSLGIEMTLRRFKPVIEKNTPVPCDERETILVTSYDNQTTCNFPIYECDEEKTYNGELISHFAFENLPPKKAGEVQFFIKMKIDQNGILNVTCTCPQVGKTIEHELDMEYKRIENFNHLLNDGYNDKQKDPKNSNDCQNNIKARNDAKKIQLL